VTASEESGIDPRHTAESTSDAPEIDRESDGDRDLAELFGPLLDEDDQPPVERTNRDDLASLFARPEDATQAADHEPDFAADIERVFASEKSTPDEAAETADADAAADPPMASTAAASSPTEASTTEGATDEAVPAASALPSAAMTAHDDTKTTAYDAAATTARDADATPARDTAGATASDTAGASAYGAADTIPSDRDEAVGSGAAAAAAFGAAGLAAGSAAASPRDGVGTPTMDGATVAGEPVETDPLAWLDLVDSKPADTPEKAALGSWLGASDDPFATRAMPASAATGAGDRTQVLAASTTADAAAGSFSPAPRRGIRGWSSRARWSVAVSIVLLVALVAGSIWVARTIADNNLAAQELAAAVAELEAAEAAATEPQAVLDTAIADYDATVEIARATAEAAAPPLAAVAGMAAQPLLDTSNAALAALIAALDADPLEDPPAPYERGEVDLGDIDAVRAATERAEDHAERVLAATREANAARTALQQNLDALRAAQVALGASLPETAVVIVGENDDASQELSDAVIAAAVAVGAAQNAGGSGDAELLAYAAAVTALREDQAREAQESTPVRPAPEPEPEPAPVPAPAPVPPPAPEPTTPPAEPTPPPAEPTPTP
jgi:hypothetical protein